MEAISLFSLLKRGRDSPKFTAVISLIVLRHNLFFTRDRRSFRILISVAVSVARKVAALVPWPFADDATSLLSPELFPAPNGNKRKLERYVVDSEWRSARKWNVYL